MPKIYANFRTPKFRVAHPVGFYLIVVSESPRFGDVWFGSLPTFWYPFVATFYYFFKWTCNWKFLTLLRRLSVLDVGSFLFAISGTVSRCFFFSLGMAFVLAASALWPIWRLLAFSVSTRSKWLEL